MTATLMRKIIARLADKSACSPAAKGIQLVSVNKGSERQVEDTESRIVLMFEGD